MAVVSAFSLGGALGVLLGGRGPFLVAGTPSVRVLTALFFSGFRATPSILFFFGVSVG